MRILKTNRGTRVASTGTHPSIYLKMLNSSRGKNVHKKIRIIIIEGVSSVICFTVREDKRGPEGGTKEKK